MRSKKSAATHQRWAKPGVRVFVNLLESEWSLVSNFKIEAKKDAIV